MRIGELQALLSHMEWADAAVWSTIHALRTTRRDERLLQLLYHFHSVQQAYLQIWRSEPIRVPEPSSFADLEALATWAWPYYPELKSFVESLEDEALSRGVEFPWSDEVLARFGSAGAATLAESVLQVVLHSTYHRGQIASRIRELGGEPPLTDFIAWLWKERPGAEWPAGAA